MHPNVLVFVFWERGRGLVVSGVTRQVTLVTTSHTAPAEAKVNHSLMGAVASALPLHF